jgi:TonB-linked SusC/RagA family outer membrane protein
MYKIYTKGVCNPKDSICKPVELLKPSYFTAVHQALLKRKLILVMKLATILMITTVLHVSAASLAQKITLVRKNASLENVFHEIKKQTGYRVLYSDLILNDEAKIDVNFKQASLDEVLGTLLKNRALTYVVENNKSIVLKESSFLDRVNRYFAAIQITGRVFDETGKPIPSASVKIKGTAKVVVTGADGRFNITVPDDATILVFSYVGYVTKEVTAKQNMVVVMQSENNLLNDLVVVGYGSSKKKDLTGSVSTIDAKDIQNVPFATFDNALAGKAAGVQVTKADGTPGGAVRIRIRGSSSLLGGNDPLYIIDGVPVQVKSNFINPGFDVGSPVGNDINNAGGVNAGLSASFVNGLNGLGGLNIDDIESISILKDASSTAIYGSKAANGVVIVTTKRGKKDMKPQITAGYYSTVSTPITPHVLNADEYKLLLTEAATNDYKERTAKNDPILPELNSIVNSPSTYFGKSNTNWIEEVTRNTISHNADLSVQGGSSATRYFSSIAYNSTPGVVKGTDYQRVTGKLNLETEIGKKFRFITNLMVGHTNQNIGDGAYGQAIKSRPDYAPYDASGIPTDFSAVGYAYLGFQNPVALLKATNNAKTLSLLGSLSALYDFNADLQFKSTASLNSQSYNQRNYIPSYLNIGNFYGNIANSGGIGGNSNSRLTNWFIENTLTYSKHINEIHDINVLAGTSYETIKNSFFSVTAQGYPDDNVLNNLSSAITPLYTRGNDPSKPQSYLLSFYLRANYSLLDKYLFTFTGRTDGSSKFGPDNKFGYFPSAAIGWRVSKENFLKDVKWIDDIKFRGSYGITGSQNIGDQMYRTLYSPFSYGGSSALIPTQLGNQGIKWESTKAIDAGLDLSFFSNRLQATVDYYNKKTNGALLALPVAPSAAYGTLLKNTADLKNTGLEISLQGDLIRNKNFRWNASVNVTWNKSLVTKLDKNADLGQIGSLTGLELGNTTLVEGEPLGLITGYKATGIIKNQAQLDAYKKDMGFFSDIFYPYLNIGDLMYELDFDTYKAYDSALPKTGEIIARAAPKYYGGFTQGFTYKNIDLQLYFTFSQGGSLLWGDHVSSTQFNGSSNANAIMLKRYTAENPDTDQPRLLFNDGRSPKSNMDVFSSSYVKLRTVSFNYRFDKSKWMERTGLINLALFASATNLFTITKYPGNDPETSNDTYSVVGGYFDASNYPTVRTFSLGLKVGF